MKVVKCDDRVLNNLPNLFELIYNLFGDKEVEVYACVDKSNSLAFLIKDGFNCYYVDSRNKRGFMIDENFNVKYFLGKDYEVYYGPMVMFIGADKKEYNVDIIHLDEPDEEGYDGEVIFNQYDPNTDTFCQLTYPHMYWEMDGKANIYSYHTQNPASVYIRENHKNSKTKDYGLLGKKEQSYNRYTFERGMLGYSIILSSEYGFFSTLLNSSYALETNDKLSRFTKARAVFAGRYMDFWPLCSLYKQEEINQIVKDYGFLLSVPDEMLNTYNGHDIVLDNIKSILEQIQKEPVQKECVMKLKMQQE